MSNINSFICEFCNKAFSKKTNLNVHKETTKSCLKLQGKSSDGFKCNICEQVFTTKANLKQHMKNKCSKEIESKKEIDLIFSLQKENEKLKENKDKVNEQIISDLRKEIEYLKSQLQKEKDSNENLQQAISQIAVNTNKYDFKSYNESYNSDDDNDDKLPSTVYEKLNEAIDTIEEKDNTLTVSTFTLNNVTITSRHPDHYVNATQLCQAGNKKFNDWFRLDTTKDLITVLSSDAGIPVSLLVESKRGQTSKFQQGSWVHPDLAIQLSQWISPSFALQVSRWIRGLFNSGSIEIDVALLKRQEKLLNIKDQRIKQLEDACLSKQRRVEYKEKNVIYMLTTDDHLKRRTYIVGKAKNLTSRLGTYNKTCDHNVIYYRECKNEEDMNIVENLVLSKLKDYREKANRDRFILPEDRDISFFIQVIDECIDFI